MLTSFLPNSELEKNMGSSLFWFLFVSLLSSYRFLLVNNL